VPKPADYGYTKLSLPTLNAVLNGSRISPKNQAIARAVLVDGEAVAALAKSNEVTTVVIYRLLSLIKRRLAATGKVRADDWVTQKVELPQALAHELHQWASQIKRAKPTQKANAVSAIQTALLQSRSALSARK
jgi:hypothetical protein